MQLTWVLIMTKVCHFTYPFVRALSRNEKAYGSEPDVFRPERHLKSARRDTSEHVFGLGRRCVYIGPSLGVMLNCFWIVLVELVQGGIWLKMVSSSCCV